MKTLWIGVAVSLASPLAVAQTTIYKHVDENGRVTYTNRPMKGAIVLDLEPEEAAKVPHPCASLDEALVSLDKDREFLTRGGVFTNDMIDAYIALKYEEVQRFRMTTHPVEFDMYYSA